MKYTIPSIVAAGFLAAGCNPVETPTAPVASPTVIFPSGSAFTDQSTLEIRGAAADGVSGITVNGVAATFDRTADAWHVDVPLTMGDNPLDIQATIGSATRDVATSAVITRSEPLIYDIGEASAYDAVNNIMYFVDRTSAQIIALNTVTKAHSTVYSQKNPDQADSKLEYIDSEIVLSSDGQILYLRGDTHSGDDIVFSVSVADGSVTYLIDDTHTDFDLLDTNGVSQIAYNAARGAAGRLYISSWRANSKPLVYDIDSGALAVMALETMSDIVGASAPEPEHLVLQSATTMSVLGQRRGGFYSFDVDLASCDGVANCTLTTSNVRTSFDSSSCIAPEESHDFSIDVNANRLIYEDFNRPTLSDFYCSLDVPTGTISRILADNEVDLDNANRFTVVDGDLYYLNSDYTLDRLTIPDSTGLPIPVVENIYAIPTIGSPDVEVGTPRQVLADPSTETVFWIDRTSGKIYKRLEDNWTTLADLGSTMSPESSVFDAQTDQLYLLEDSSGRIISQVDVETGAVSTLLDLPDTGADMDINRIDAIALNEVEQVLYLAVEFYYDSVPDGFGQQGLVQLNIASGELTMIAGAIDAEDFDDLRPSFDMVFDVTNDRVLFYYSSSSLGNPIVAIDVDDGTRWLFSTNNMFIDPISTSNARGHVMDIANNRMLSTSQNDQSVFGIDLDNGMRTHISENTLDNGVLLRQPKGIAILADKSLAYIADEGVDALFEMDLTTGERVIIQH
ncbi:Uncharacterised protein [BD1-7 clade bacterium]|uniref:Uncharacterized protein n=1 Tax=BD1-7 clade bacterium TaxID=2029982 RepID=A0A5S9PK92_9GAMM|nr:Uncharacterised protein [BD1-7 clade bacterium]